MAFTVMTITLTAVTLTVGNESKKSVAKPEKKQNKCCIRVCDAGESNSAQLLGRQLC